MFYFLAHVIKRKFSKTTLIKLFSLNRNFAGYDHWQNAMKLKHANRRQMRHLLIFHGTKFVLSTSYWLPLYTSSIKNRA